MKLKLFGALLGAIMLMAAAPAGAATVTGTPDINSLGSVSPGTLNFSGTDGINGAEDNAILTSGKLYYDYVFSFSLTGTSKVTLSTNASTGSFNISEYHAAFFSSNPAGTALTVGSNPGPLISLPGSPVPTATGTTNGGTLLNSLTLAAGTYYLRLFGVLPGNLNSGHHLSSIGGNLSVAATPIPAALPLFATALGMMGFFGWRRKSTAAVAAV